MKEFFKYPGYEFSVRIYEYFLLLLFSFFSPLFGIKKRSEVRRGPLGRGLMRVAEESSEKRDILLDLYFVGWTAWFSGSQFPERD